MEGMKLAMTQVDEEHFSRDFLAGQAIGDFQGFINRPESVTENLVTGP